MEALRTIFYRFFWIDLYYNIKQGITNLIRYFFVVWNQREWDFEYTLDIVQFKLELLYKNLDKYSNEVREDLDPKLLKIKETIELIKRIKEDKYYECCGYITPTKHWFEPCTDSEGYILKTNSTQTSEELYNIFTQGAELETKEFEQIMNNLKDARSWWY
jgi:hypothetical protein